MRSNTIVSEPALENKATADGSPERIVARRLHLSFSPHIRSAESVPEIMRWVLIALIPPFAASLLYFGLHALLLTLVSVAAALLTEYTFTRLQRKPSTLHDFTAVITGVLLAFTLPPGISPLIAAAGSVFAVGVVKMSFGGLGMNFMNPALAGRAFLSVCYPSAMALWVEPRWGTMSGLNGISSATPLAYFKSTVLGGTFQALDFQEALPNLLFGNVGGCIGATSAAALLLGALILWYKGIIGFRIPLSFLGTAFILFWAFGGTGEYFTSDAFIAPVYQLLAGSLVLGALFMANDPVTSPITPAGKIAFGAGCGMLTFIIRKFGGYPEGVCFAIILMNCVVPLLNRYTRPRAYGEVVRRG